MSTITATAAFAQYRRHYTAVTTTANTTYDTPTNTQLLAVAGPDGAIVTHIGSTPRMTVTANQMQLFLSKDGGTTKTFCLSALMAGYSMAQTTLAPTTVWNNYDGNVISETNPIALSGMSDFGSTTPTACGTSGGAANAQTLPFANVSAYASGTYYDFEAGLTNTAGTTLSLGTAGVKTVVRDTSGAALSAGDITAGFRYRVWYDGSNLRLIITDRLYVAMGVSFATGVVTAIQQADF